ncbi:hypothetical protein LJB86_00580 [Deltaproteobacteria bacterium OttesenSCG-928-M10]|nr:hypothetical protein [Deltaproteobacteria bacterium OttesenSCG-928-M10]
MIRQNAVFLGLAFFCGLAGGLAGIWLGTAREASADSGRALVGEEMRLTDDTGRTRLLLTLVRGKPRLLMLDDDGEYRLELGLGASGEPHIWLRDREGAAKVQVALNDKGRPSFRLADHRGRERAILGLSDDGEPTMILRDESGYDRTALWHDRRAGGLALADGQGRPIAAFSAREGETAALSFFDENGQAYRIVE